MRDTDPTYNDSAATIIPFAPRPYDLADDSAPAEAVSTIVAIVAVTLRHGSDETPEERLADLIEETGHAEIIEIQDACRDGFGETDALAMGHCLASNDNSA